MQYEVIEDTWKAGKRYLAGECYEFDEDPGNWCKCVDPKKRSTRREAKEREDKE